MDFEHWYAIDGIEEVGEELTCCRGGKEDYYFVIVGILAVDNVFEDGD